MDYKRNKTAVTLMELLVALVIIGILATISVSVYVGHVERARVAAARNIIRQLEGAIVNYEVDTGQLPPSSSGLTYAPDDLLYENNPNTGSFGSGYLQLALIHSLSGNQYEPLHYRWQGPYIELDEEQIGDRDGGPVTASTPKGLVQILDPWGMPYYYIRAADYEDMGGTEYPTNHAFYDTETYYNPSSFQIFSTGRNLTTFAVPYRGEETDDVTNWRQYGRRLVTAAASGGGGGSRQARYASSGRGDDDSRTGPTIFNAEDSWAPDHRRSERVTYPVPGGGMLLFQWPRGWNKNGELMENSEDPSKPAWLFKAAPGKSFESIAAPYKQPMDAEIAYEGPDPTQTIADSYVLEVKSSVTPEPELIEDSVGKPYHLLFAFKHGRNTCWWTANFESFEDMEEGRFFITGIVRNKASVSK